MFIGVILFWILQLNEEGVVILRNHNFAVVEDVYAGDRQGFFRFTDSTV